MHVPAGTSTPSDCFRSCRIAGFGANSASASRDSYWSSVATTLSEFARRSPRPLADGGGAYHIKVAYGSLMEPYCSDPEVDRLHRNLYGC